MTFVSFSGHRVHSISDHVQRCDARRPCTSCIRAGCTLECVYDEKDPQSVGTDPAVALKVISAAPRTLRVGEVPRPPELILVRRNSVEQSISLDSNSSISIISSFLRPIIPSEPWIPLSFLWEEKLQVQFQETGATDMDMKLCVLS